MVRVAFDIDDTLRRLRAKEDGENRVTVDAIPDYDLIAVLRWFHGNGDSVFAWSAGGVEYTRNAITNLGLDQMVTIIPKMSGLDMDIIFDDQDAKALGKILVKVKRP
jgi:hypothetical protein